MWPQDRGIDPLPTGTAEAVKHPDESVDGLFANKVRVIQSLKGYRVSEDALILTWFVRPRSGELILDAGTGCGAIAFGLAAREPSITIVALELQAGLADRARRGVRLNRIESRVLPLRGDMRCADQFLRCGHFDVVVCNPPYHEPGRGRISQQEEKAVSRHQLMMPVSDLLRVSARLLRPEGRLALIYPAARADRLRAAAKEAGFGPCRVLWIHPCEAVGPCLVCVEARHGLSDCSVTESSLFLYREPGRRTAIAQAILSGEDVTL